MLNGHVPGMTDADAGCATSKTGFCKDCPLFISMPFDVRNPVTGETIRSGTVFDCVHVWSMMGSWDSANQAIGVHAAVSQHANKDVALQVAALEEMKASNKASRTHEQAMQREARAQSNFLDNLGRLAIEARKEEQQERLRVVVEKRPLLNAEG